MSRHRIARADIDDYHDDYYDFDDEYDDYDGIYFSIFRIVPL